MELSYPTHNRFGLPLEFIDRRIDVAAVRDFARRPLDARFIVRSPLVRRGRLLITGTDSATGADRKFWIEAASGRQLPPWRLGLYDPEFPGELVDLIGRVFGPSERDRLAMKKVARRWFQIVRERGDIGLRLAAFPIEA